MVESPNSITDLNIFCPQCDYNLSGTVGDRCSSCGWEIDVDVLAAYTAEKPIIRRVASIITSIVLGVGSIAITASLTLHAPSLSLMDWIAILGVMLASAGHLILAGLSIACGPRWPMRMSEAANMLSLAAWLSMIACVIGATAMLDVAPTARMVRGVKVNGVLEFVIAATLFIFPAVTLHMMRISSFRYPSSKRKTRKKKSGSLLSSHAGRVSFSVDVMRRYTTDQITQDWNDKPRPSTPTLNAAIERIWETESVLAKENDLLLYNSELIRLHKFRCDSSNLHFDFGRTCYRDFLGTNMHNTKMVMQAGQEYFANPLGISALILTPEGRIILGKRSHRVAYHAGYIHTFGGMLEVSDRKEDGTVDVFGGMIRELREELGIDEKDITDISITGLVRDHALQQPELLFGVSISQRASEISKQFDPSRGEREHTKLIYLHDEPESIVPFINNTRMVAPVARAALLLHGRHQWGKDWYEQSCYLLYGELPKQQ